MRCEYKLPIYRVQITYLLRLRAVSSAPETALIPLALVHLRLQGDPEGQYELGKRFDQGHGVPCDARTAVGWYEKAARQGHGKALCTLGWCYAKGHGVEKSEHKAFSLFMRAAELKTPEGQFNLGVCYAKGRGCAVDMRRAEEMYNKAASNKHW